jgi:hypothetical protein
LFGLISAGHFLLLNLSEELSQFLITGAIGILYENGAGAGTL